MNQMAKSLTCMSPSLAPRTYVIQVATHARMAIAHQLLLLKKKSSIKEPIACILRIQSFMTLFGCYQVLHSNNINDTFSPESINEFSLQREGTDYSFEKNLVHSQVHLTYRH